MSRERRLASRKVAGRGRPPACELSCFPRFTALRIELGYSRHRLAMRLRDLGFDDVDEAVLIRLETKGYSLRESLIVGFSIAFGRPADEIRALFEEVA